MKLSSAYAAQTSYNTQVQQTLLPYTNNSQNILQLDQLGISSAGTLWFIDLYNQRVLGVDSTVGSTVSTIDLTSVGGALAIGVSIYSANIWAATPGASTGTSTVSQYDPTGAKLQTFSTSTDSTNLPSTYFVMGVEPDPTNTLVYVGGCNQVVANSIVYEPGAGFEYATAPGQFMPCDIRAISQSTGLVVQTYAPTQATRNFYGSNSSFFQSIIVRSGTSNGGNVPAGAIWADDTFNGVVYAFNNMTGAQLQNSTGISSSPAFTPSNGIVFLGQNGLSVQQYGGGTPSTVYSISNVTFGNPGFVAVGNGGSPVYVSSLSGGPVAVMTSSTPPSISSYIGGSYLYYPEGMAVDGSGNLYVIDGGTNIGYKFTSSGNLVFNFTYPNSGIGAGICVDGNNGNIYVPADNIASGAAAGTGYVLIFNSNGQFVNLTGQAISYPWTCAVLSNGMVVVDSANEPGTIFFLNPTTGATTSFQDLALGNSFETLGMAVSNDGRIFVAALNLGIYVFSSTGQYIDVISSPQEDIYSYSMAYTSSGGGLLYVADAFNQRVVTFKVGTSGPGGSSDAAHTVSSLATTAALTVAALVFTLFISA